MLSHLKSISKLAHFSINIFLNGTFTLLLQLLYKYYQISPILALEGSHSVSQRVHRHRLDIKFKDAHYC
jgi:hypothetical protein